MSTPKDWKNSTAGDDARVVPQKKEKGKNKRRQIMRKAQDAALQLRNESHALGSYTGLSHDGGIPEQDADDL